MEPRQNRAYNQTRECFLGMEVIAGDFSPASLNEWFPTLTPNSGAGIWLVPFRGIPATDLLAPLDLVYLDQDCRVLDTVEFFPTYRVSPSSPLAASVLALPTHSIFSSQTRKGDQLMLCATSEMTWRLEQLAQSGTAADRDSVASTDTDPGMHLQREEPKPGGAPAPSETSDLPMRQNPPPVQPQREELPNQADRNSLASPAGKSILPPRRWLERWLFPEPADPRRKTPRLPALGLVAHFFTGGGPQAHYIRDISASGLYVVTSERWYPGTLVRITLSKPDDMQPAMDRSITIQARSVRWGNDGVGLEFVFDAPKKPRPGHPSPVELVDNRQFGQFLKRLSAGGP